MATGQYHCGGEYVAGGDVSAANYAAYGSADIPEGRIVLLDTSNTFGANQPRGVVLPTASGGVAGTYGITIETLRAKNASGELRVGRVRIAGSYWVPANGSITAGDAIQASDTADKLGYAKTAGAGVEQVGKAITSAADGEMVLVEIARARNA